MLKNLNPISLCVADIELSIAFYKALGFEVVSNGGSVAEVRLASTRLQFIAQEATRDEGTSFQRHAFGGPKGMGMYLNIKVRNVDDYYSQLVVNGIKPSTEPRDWPWGQREFLVRDPDRYKLAFYQKTGS